MVNSFIFLKIAINKIIKHIFFRVKHKIQIQPTIKKYKKIRGGKNNNQNYRVEMERWNPKNVNDLVRRR